MLKQNLIDQLFCYGTLEFPDVMQAVTGRAFCSQAGELADYARYVIIGAIYPGVIHRADARTPGTLYSGIDAVTLRRLDHYEGDLYERILSPVTNAKGEPVTAWIYVIPARNQEALSTEPWDKEKFRRRHLRHYLKTLNKSAQAAPRHRGNSINHE